MWTRQISFSTKVPAFFIVVLCACCTTAIKIKRMEGFDEDVFYKRYYGKEPVVITKLKASFKAASSEILNKCNSENVRLTRLPSMQEDLEDISLTTAFRPCGADCYGVYENKVCVKALEDEGIELPEAFDDDEVDRIWFSVAQHEIETPATVTAGHYFRFLTAGVEDWRLLTRFEEGIIDLFTQQVYEEKLVTGDLLYVPPSTLTQHTALTPLSVSLGIS